MRSDLPSGTVTFLFTDVDGSTRLLHELGADAYAEALAEHRRVIREACAGERGAEVDTQGDAFFFAFPTAPGALAAASAFTETLAAGPIQVRVGLHTGTPLLTVEGYVGDDVHFAPRVAASAHGSQVILSSATAELVELPLTDLGEHRLKDIAEPVSIFQLGEESFPPLKTISNTNLPRPASSFLGREAELQEVLSRIEAGARLVTLTDPGGTGKTRLALEAATSLVPEYKAGVFWVGLASLRDPALVTETIAQTLGAKDSLAEHIGEREILLLLDNLEQAIDAASDLSDLLSACANLTLLVTSREPLRIAGEVEYPVPPLAEPEAVELFCARAQTEPSEEIAELCEHLDSLPLAVELAAARTKVLTPAQILERLASRLDLLKGARDADPRQQTLRATIEWSYDLLTPEEREIFARLSVFAGGCTLDAAEGVCDADLDTLQSLVEKSLLRFTPSETGGRYWMLETIREYAGGSLAAETRRTHAEFYRDLTLRVDADLRSDHDAVLLDQLAIEHDNIRAALTWFLPHDPMRGVETVAAMGGYWWMRGHIAEERRWLNELLDRRDRLTPETLARGLAELSFVAGEQGDRSEATLSGQEALRIARELGDDDIEYRALESLANTYWVQGRDIEAEAACEQARSIAKRSGNPYREAAITFNLGALAQGRGDLARARALMEEALVLAHEIGTQEGVASTLVGLGSLLRQEGKLDESLAMLREGLVQVRSLGFPLRLALGVLEVSAVLLLMGEFSRAALLLGASEAAFQDAGTEIDDVANDVVPRPELELGTGEFSRLRSLGHGMSLEDAVELALASID